MKQRIHNFFSFIFWLTLVIYIGIWFTVSYIGVYVTYVAAPTLLISGIIAYLSSDKDS